MGSPRHILQCARTIGPGYGVSGPAYQLEKAFLELGCRCERFTLENLGLRSSSNPTHLFVFWRDIFVFSVLGSLALWWRYRRGGPDVICQVDALFGRLHVVRAVHKGFLLRHPARLWMLLRNPMHWFVLLRDFIRYRWGVHEHLVALSEPNKQELIDLYGVEPEKITVIPNGVDLSRFRPDPEARAQVRRELELESQGLVGIFVGHEFERKGLGVVLEAVRGLPLDLLVAGNGNPAAYPGQDRVKFLGHLDDLERYYAAADFLVMPTRHDVSPLVGPEALACGLPLLMTPVGGVAEYLQDGVNGRFIERDPAPLRRLLVQLLEGPAELERMAAQARPSVEDRDWKTIAVRYLDLLDRLDDKRDSTRPRYRSR